MNTTIKTNLNSSISSLAEKDAQMTEAELSLLMRIMDMVIGNPARRQFVMNYNGKMKDLTAVLETI